MKTLNEFDMKRKLGRKLPGPGTYETVDCTKSKLADPKFSFGTEKRPALGRNKDQLNIPGPAAYTA
jgi:hypothetical protein